MTAAVKCGGHDKYCQRRCDGDLSYLFCDGCESGARTSWWSLAMLGHAVTVGVLATRVYWVDGHVVGRDVPKPDYVGPNMGGRVLRAALGES